MAKGVRQSAGGASTTSARDRTNPVEKPATHGRYDLGFKRRGVGNGNPLANGQRPRRARETFDPALGDREAVPEAECSQDAHPTPYSAAVRSAVGTGASFGRMTATALGSERPARSERRSRRR